MLGWPALQLSWADFSCLQRQEGLSWLQLGEVALPRSMLHARPGDCCKSAGHGLNHLQIMKAVRAQRHQVLHRSHCVHSRLH